MEERSARGAVTWTGVLYCFFMSLGVALSASPSPGLTSSISSSVRINVVSAGFTA